MPTQSSKRRKVGTGGPWGTGLLLLGVAVTVQGIGYMAAAPKQLTPALAELSQHVPPWVWGIGWVAAGVWSVWKALTPPQHPLELIPVVTVFSLWAAANLVHWLILGLGSGVWTRGWSSAVGWSMLTGLVISWGRCVNPPRVAKVRRE